MTTEAQSHHWVARSGRCPTIIATAAINGLGFNPHQIWALARAEQTAFAESPFICPNGKHATMAHVATLPSTVVGVERLVTLTRAVIQQVLPEPRLLTGARRVGVFLALPERMGEPQWNTVHSMRQRQHLTRDVTQTTATWPIPCDVWVAPHGHAAGAFSLHKACQGLATGEIEAAIVVGVDSYYDPVVVQSLIDAQRIFDGDNTNALIGGEGAAAALLVTAATAASMRLPARGYVESVAVAKDPATPINDIPCDGTALSNVARAALAELVREGRVLDMWLNDLTGEEMRAHELLLALPRVSHGSMQASSRMQHLPECCGDWRAATLPTAWAVACEMFAREDNVHSCLTTASTPSGERGAILLRRP